MTAIMKKFDTLTDLAKSESNWHFDPSIVEKSLTSLARFSGNWDAELNEIVQCSDRNGGTKTITFENYSGRNKHTKFEELEMWGYQNDQKFVDVIRCDKHSFVDDILDKCNIINPVPSIIRLKPGYIQPWHCDMYNSYKRKFGTNCETTRLVITLRDWCWGHYLLFGNEVFHQWVKGDCITWPYLRYHCASNAGISDLLLLTVTGQRPTAEWPVG